MKTFKVPKKYRFQSKYKHSTIDDDLKPKQPKKHPDINKAEYGIKNYLNKHNIYKGNHDMHAVIINSFIVDRGVKINESWLYKLYFIQEHFGLFAQYANNNWKKIQYIKHPKQNEIWKESESEMIKMNTTY